MMLRSAPALLLLIPLTGCTRGLQGPDLGELYTRPAMAAELRNPVIVIPGILGSRLVAPREDRIVWGAFSGRYANPESAEGARLVAVPLLTGDRRIQTTARVQPDGVLDRARVSLLGLPLQLDAYSRILATLGAGGYRDEELGRSGAIDYGDDHFTCFQFPYDWRQDNATNARHLYDFIEDKRALVQAEIERRTGEADADVKFDIVAHSMGGLITRYFLRYGKQDLPPDGSLPELNWDGARHVRKAVLIGTPNSGSTKALIQMVHGVRFAPTLPKFEPAILGSMPSIYQLLPRNHHRRVVLGHNRETAVPDLYDPAWWEEQGWGLANPDQDDVLELLLPHLSHPAERRAVALRTQRRYLELARQFHAALDVPAARPEGLDLYLVAGDAEDTAAVAAVDTQRGRVWTVEETPGDGTVTRDSALADDRVGATWRLGLDSPIDWTHVIFLFRDHLGITQDPVFADNLLFLLLER